MQEKAKDRKELPMRAMMMMKRNTNDDEEYTDDEEEHQWLWGRGSESNRQSEVKVRGGRWWRRGAKSWLADESMPINHFMPFE